MLVGLLNNQIWENKTKALSLNFFCSFMRVLLSINDVPKHIFIHPHWCFIIDP